MDATRDNNPNEAEAAGNARRPVGELIFAFVLMLAILSIFVQALPLPLFQSDGTVGPGFFPVSLSILMIVLVGAYIVFLALGSRRSQPRDTRQEPTEAVVTGDQFVLAGLLVLGILVGNYIGLLAVTGIVLLAGLVFVERVGWRAGILFTLGTLIGVYLVFDLWLGMDVGLRGLFR